MKGKICVSIYGTNAAETLDRIERARAGADLIEVRFDALDDTEIDRLLDELPIESDKYLFTFRPKERGGLRPISIGQRLKFWERVIHKFNGCDFFADLEPDILSSVDLQADRTIVSHHDFERTPADLDVTVTALSDLSNGILKIAVTANDICDSIQLWKLFVSAAAADGKFVPIAMGEAGKWTRILSLAHGAPMTFAAPDADGKTAPGQISVEEMLDLYRVGELNRETRVYGVVAGDTSYSMSPYLHNTAFAAANLNSVFVPLQVKDLGQFIRRMVRRETREIDLNFCGFAVTNPHKVAIIPHLDKTDAAARAIGAVNTVSIGDDGRLLGFNTDAAGFIAPLEKKFTALAGARVAVAGAGGAARGCVYALRNAGVEAVTVFARSVERARDLADEFGVTIEELRIAGDERGATDLSGYDIVVNTTPLGTRGENEERSIARAEQLRGVSLVYDLNYNPVETRLLSEAKAAGCATLGGLDMLAAQAAMQFTIWTGLDQAPTAAMRAAAEKKLATR
ncbi:MAG: shikimate dehydrogenase [Pyrinomonadaceae bacterium]